MKYTNVFAAIAAMCLTIGLGSCSESHSVNGKIAGLDNGDVYVEYMPINSAQGTDPVQDTIKASGDKFFFDLPREQTLMVYVKFPKQNVMQSDGNEYESMHRVMILVVKPDEKFTVNGSIENPDFLSYTVKGEGFNADLAAQRESYKIASIKADSVDLLAINYQTEQGIDRDSIVEALMDERGKYIDQIYLSQDDYLAAHPDTDLSAFYLLQKDIPSFGESYSKLGSNAVNGLFAETLKNRKSRYDAYLERVETARNVIPGAQAPDFTLTDLAGNQVTLSSLSGKYVVLDFWGSWCSWCIKGIPQMKEYYAKYNRRIEFVGIACRDTPEKWQAAVAQHQLPWLQLLNDQSGDKSLDVSAKYGVQAFPTKIILDKEHKIVAVVQGESPEFYQKIEELMK